MIMELIHQTIIMIQFLCECFLFLEENNFESKLVKGGINAPISLFEVYERLEKSN
jgi:hypothetical protein